MGNKHAASKPERPATAPASPAKKQGSKGNPQTDGKAKEKLLATSKRDGEDNQKDSDRPSSKIEQKPDTTTKIDKADDKSDKVQQRPATAPAQRPKIEDGGCKIVRELENKKRDKLLVAAIDFGTTYSGYASLMKNSFEENKDDNNYSIHCPTWTREGGMTYQAPTSVLFRPNKTFHSFGYDAERFYHDNSDRPDLKEWYYFKHFKMKLFTDKDILSKDTLIDDNREVGHTMKAVEVFGAVIKFFKDHLLDSFATKTDNNKYITNDDIHWVITVPAIWDIKAKTFMIDAAEQAGISGDQLTLALEPEAASLYCRKVPISVESNKDGGKEIAAMQKGSKYIVFDQGGGTTDITVHEVTDIHKLKEIHQACGGHYGGNTVNEQFFSFLSKLFSGPVLRELRTNHPSEYFDFMNSFEAKKTSFTEKDPSDNKTMVTIRFPKIWTDTFTELTGETIDEAIENSMYKDRVVVVNDKIRVNVKIFRSFFDFSINNVLRIFEELFKKPEISKIDTLLAVGGYSESTILINAIKQKFPSLNVIVPRDPGLAVIKGAVLYGFEPHSITERVSRYTYGVAMQAPYDADKFDKSKISTRRSRHGKLMVDDVFDKHVEIGQVLRVGEFQDEHDYYPLMNEQKIAHFEFYASEEKNPKYVTDKTCQMIGLFSVQLTGDSSNRKVFLKLNASGTEILAVARAESTGIETRAYFSLF